MWEVIGFQYSYDEESKPKGVTLFLTKPFKKGDGEGLRAKRIWYRPSEVTYQPVIGDKVCIDVEVRGKYEIVTDIYK